MSPTFLPREKRLLLILAPKGRDAAIIERVLEPLDTRCERCGTLAELTRRLGDEATAAILTEESLEDNALRTVQSWIETQPPWSDFPFVVLASPQVGRRTREAMEALADLGNDVLLERPLSADTLTKAVKSAMRSRRRQYEARAQLQRLETIGRENQRLYESERQARAEAEAANRAKDEFLATLSHELRTPLSAILGWTYVLQQRRPELGDLARGIDTIQRNAMSQSRLIEDLLDMSRIVAGKVSLELQTVVPAMLIEQVLASLAPTAQAMNITVSGDLDAALTPINGDGQRLLQVFRNLLANAVKFTPEGGHIRVCACASDRELSVRVIDDGIGIAPHFLPYVFDRFRQADGSTTRSQGGLGLGLAIVRRLVELHGGRVEASSAGVGKGATFEVRLPLAHAERSLHDVEPPDAESGPASDRRASIAGLKVLLVEDDRDSREMVEQLLSEAGATVTAVASAAQALQVLADERFDVMISDIGMPSMDGYELMQRVKAAGIELPAIALTAFARSEDRDHALAAGFTSHLVKPVDPLTLAGAVATAARGMLG